MYAPTQYSSVHTFSILLCLILLIPVSAQINETEDQCSSVDRTIFLSIQKFSGNYSFGTSESGVSEDACIQFELINYDYDEDNVHVLHHFDMLESENEGIPTTHRSFPLDGSHKFITIFVPNGSDGLTIFCGDADHRNLGLELQLVIDAPPPPITRNTNVSTSVPPTYPTLTEKKVIIPGFQSYIVFPVLLVLIFLSTNRKRLLL